MSDNAPTHSCGLYLSVTAAGGASVASRLAPFLSSKNIACVLIAPSAEGAFDIDVAKMLCEAGQGHDIAVLVRDDLKVARDIGADGVHLSWTDDVVRLYHNAREVLGLDSIIGADAGRSRHDAMTLGESGADYVAFGVPSHVQDTDKARSRQLDLIEWWGGIFEVPCVACDVTDFEQTRELARAGADFVVLDLPEAVSGGDLGTWLDGTSGVLA